MHWFFLYPGFCGLRRNGTFLGRCHRFSLGYCLWVMSEGLFFLPGFSKLRQVGVTGGCFS
ncbi:hypothetical protein B9Z19DRAFT_1075635 [Tuber borchii]|uniref:Uncharacterized protein n=1 Tax=Tuber borchii TaxID=42251 RepID=A0A2T7A325_TUBBO|nr:hypothetical protein B9Z19DRAFT_1075635 [Tuber borchii]